MVLGRRQLLIAGALAVVGLSACGDPPRARFEDATAEGPNGTGGVAAEPTRIISVGMVGDSITQGSVDELQAAFVASGIDDIRIDGDKGRRIEVGNGKGPGPVSGVRTLYAMLADGFDPDAWVIELGTNDVGSYRDEAAYGELIDQVLTMLPADRPLAWVNVFRPDHLDHTDLFNAALQGRIDARTDAVIVDWHSHASAPDQTILRSDGLHPNSDGSQVLALLVAQALQGF
ncbi:MAG: GDSL-type esterase/lipase family protein [Ilumatobacteraceae bacterium]